MQRVQFGVGGMVLTLAGIAIVVFGRRTKAEAAAHAAGAAAGTLRSRPHRLRGLLLAGAATLGQAGGLILSKLGATAGAVGGAAGGRVGTIDPFAGTQIRVTAAVLGFAIALVATRSWKGVFSAFKDRRAIASLSLGSFFGPFLGVSLSLLAVQSGNTGVASAIMSITPILIIAPSALILKERIALREILGSVIAVAGVFALFMA